MKVVVLLSTWNGANFITEQLLSILPQLASSDQVFIRDDGSTDETVERITELDDSRITVLRGDNLGFAHSFFTLLKLAPDDADVVMLCDQDDVWLPDKVARACAQLAHYSEQPALYCSRLQLVDVNLVEVGLSPHWPRPPAFQNALAENIVTGCTCAMNRQALQLTRDCGDVGLVYFHDWWLYLVVSAFGTVIFDPVPTVLYRQHGRNIIGMGSGIGRYLSILRFLRKKSWVHIMYDQIENFRTVHAERLSTTQKLLLDTYFSPHRPASMLRLLFSARRFRQTMVYEVLLRSLVLGSWIAGRGLTSRRNV